MYKETHGTVNEYIPDKLILMSDVMFQLTDYNWTKFEISNF